MRQPTTSEKREGRSSTAEATRLQTERLPGLLLSSAALVVLERFPLRPCPAVKDHREARRVEVPAPPAFRGRWPEAVLAKREDLGHRTASRRGSRNSTRSVAMTAGGERTLAQGTVTPPS